jgi:hypothetical protein
MACVGDIHRHGGLIMCEEKEQKDATVCVPVVQMKLVAVPLEDDNGD